MDAHSVGVPVQQVSAAAHTHELPRSPIDAAVQAACVVRRLHGRMVALSGENPHPEHAMGVPRLGAGAGASRDLAVVAGMVAIRKMAKMATSVAVVGDTERCMHRDMADDVVGAWCCKWCARSEEEPVCLFGDHTVHRIARETHKGCEIRGE